MVELKFNVAIIRWAGFMCKNQGAIIQIEKVN